ncbi:MAG: DUF4388 domain-containing protein [Deltaproteobacteria bacterium]|nr:DUF4388 domain-containing protein [Deltaproteobacteria bacterium]
MSVKGRLKDLNLQDIFQILHAEGKTVAVHLGSEHGYGNVYFKDGNIVHADYRGFTGVDALSRLLGWKEGEFDVATGELPKEETIIEDFDWLMKEAARRFNETTAPDTQAAAIETADIEKAALIRKLIDLGILERIG